VDLNGITDLARGVDDVSSGFGDVQVGSTKSLFLQIGDAVDTDLGDANALDILGLSITGPDQSAFILSDGDAMGRFGLGDLGEATISFDPTEHRQYDATLRIITDVGAPLGQAGQVYTINLSANAVPEPSAATLLIVTGCAIAVGRRPKGRIKSGTARSTSTPGGC
jgi:hypothetical protein